MGCVASHQNLVPPARGTLSATAGDQAICLASGWQTGLGISAGATWPCWRSAPWSAASRAAGRRLGRVDAVEPVIAAPGAEHLFGRQAGCI